METTGKGLLAQLKVTSNIKYSKLDADTFFKNLNSLANSIQSKTPVLYCGENLYNLYNAISRNDKEEIKRLEHKMTIEMYERWLKDANRFNIDYDLYYLLSKIFRQDTWSHRCDQSWTIKHEYIYDEESIKYCEEKGYDYEPTDSDVIKLKYKDNKWFYCTYIQCEYGYGGNSNYEEKEITGNDVFKLILDGE